tara:strand:+ start:258 stop:440 length:183 start_codon:yes stop_codon:yes gene_type:complete
MKHAMVSRINIAYRGGHSWVYIDLDTHKIALPFVFKSQEEAIEAVGAPVVRYNPNDYKGD